jgi:protocatechuate 3,4-dioxygenase beta subunit
VRRAIGIIAVLAVAAAAMAGCGDDTAENAGTTAAAAETTAATTTATVATGDGTSRVSTSTCTTTTTPTTEGPYYVTGTDRLRDGELNDDALPGERIRISGYVYRGTGTGTPLAGAVVDVWQADDAGDYWPESNGPASGYTAEQLSLRGSVVTDASGFYTFTTIFPGEYEGRARHIHIRFTAAEGDGDVVTQLIMSKDGDRTPAESDGIARSLPDCHTMRFADGGDGIPTAFFDAHL